MSDHDLLEEVLDSARQVAPDALSVDDIDRMIGVALSGESRGEPEVEVETSPERGRTVMVLAIAATVLLSIGAGWMLRDRDLGSDDSAVASSSPDLATEARDEGAAQTAPDDSVALREELADPAQPAPTEAIEAVAANVTHTHARLPSGDQIVSTSDAELSLLSVSEHRRVAVLQGAVLFDVTPLQEAESFTVVSSDLEVHVRGTVFSVSHAGEVRVFEGRVEVTRGDQRWSVSAGESFRDERLVEQVDDGPLAREGQAAAARREARAEEVEVAQVAETVTETVTETATQTPSSARPSRPRPARRARTPRVESLAQIRARIRGGDLSGALSQVDLACRLGCAPGYRRVRADALRGLGRFEEAASAYDALSDPHARYQAARVRFGPLADLEGAVTSLSAVPLSSPYAERALGLKVRALTRLEREAEARAAARVYLGRFPDGGLREFMESIVE